MASPTSLRRGGTRPAGRFGRRASRRTPAAECRPRGRPPPPVRTPRPPSWPGLSGAIHGSLTRVPAASSSRALAHLVVRQFRLLRRRWLLCLAVGVLLHALQCLDQRDAGLFRAFEHV